MDLTAIAFEEFRKVQAQIRQYVEDETQKFAGVELNNLERMSINEIIRHLMENYIGTFEDFTWNDNLTGEEGKKRWARLDKGYDIYKDAYALFLLNYGVDARDYLNHQYQEWFKEGFRHLREECIKL